MANRFHCTHVSDRSPLLAGEYLHPVAFEGYDCRCRYLISFTHGCREGEVALIGNPCFQLVYSASLLRHLRFSNGQFRKLAHQFRDIRKVHGKK